MKSTQRLTEGAALLAIFGVMLLITIYVPFLAIISMWFLPLPFIYFAWKNDLKSILVFFVASLFISIIIGTIKSVPIAIIFGATGVTLGYLVQKNRSRAAITMAGSLVFLISIVIYYGAAVALFQFNFLTEATTLLKKAFDTSFQILDTIESDKKIEKLSEQLDIMIMTMETLFPSLLVMGSFLIVMFLQLINFPILKRFGVIPTAWKPFRELSIPKSILWYYLLTALLFLLLKPETGSYLYLALWNLAFITQNLLVLHGLSFVYYVSFLKGWPKVVPIVVTVLGLIQPLILYIIRILGIIDIGFDLRKRILKK